MAISRKLLAEAGHACKPKPLHQGEARARDKREAVIGERSSDGLCRFEIRGSDRLDLDAGGARAAPEPLRFRGYNGRRPLSERRVGHLAKCLGRLVGVQGFEPWTR